MASLPVFKELNTGIDAKETDNCACACEKERAHLQRNECKKKKETNVNFRKKKVVVFEETKICVKRNRDEKNNKLKNLENI